MPTDLVVPVRNEAALMEMAVRLGYDCLVLAYRHKPDAAILAPPNLNIFLASLEHPAPWADLAIARGKIESRGLLSNKDIDGIYDLEITSSKDFMHQRASGLNEALGVIAARTGKLIILNFSLLLMNERAERGTIMGRMSQNIRVCRTTHAPLCIASMATTPYAMRSHHDLAALHCALGMHPREAQQALSILGETAHHRKDVKEGRAIGRYVRMTRSS